MTLASFDRQAFETQLNEWLSPAQPIATTQHLHGRADELARIEKALALSGRHVFIYGDRGVGKSSLAATAANQIQSADKPYINVSGSSDEDFSSIIKNIAYKAGERSDLRTRERIQALGLSLRGLSTSQSVASSARDIDQTITVADATRILQEIAASYSEHTVVVVDEFDRIPDPASRYRFAELLKHLGDANVDNLRFIFTGIASSIDELLGAHRSAIRQLHTLELPRLSYDGCWDIAIAAAKAFGIELPRDVYIRIAQLSDGFPYYVHLMMEKILWEAFETPDLIAEVDWNLFEAGLQEAVRSVAAELKAPYERVLRHPSSDEFEVVLWATANGGRPYEEFSTFRFSYEKIAEELNVEPLSKEKFRRRINSLMTDSLGNILSRDPIHPRRFYVYSEKMFRGYVRMQAEANGIQLTGATGPEKRVIWQSVKQSPRYQQSSPPRGWRR